MSTLAEFGGTDRLKPALNENNNNGNQIINIIPTNKIPPKPYLTTARRFEPRGVGYF
jgi:hypothetical protein